MSKKKNTHTGYRDAEDGQFVSQRYAENHPKTTVREQVPNPGKSPESRKD